MLRIHFKDITFAHWAFRCVSLQGWVGQPCKYCFYLRPRKPLVLRKRITLRMLIIWYLCYVLLLYAGIYGIFSSKHTNYCSLKHSTRILFFFCKQHLLYEIKIFSCFFCFCIWRTHSHVLFWGNWYPCFRFLVTSPLGFEARVGSALFALRKQM